MTRARLLLAALAFLLAGLQLAGLPACNSGGDGDADVDTDVDTDTDSDADCENPTDCSLGQVCVARTCVAGCGSSRDCPAGKSKCDKDSGDHGECVECVVNDDCGSLDCIDRICTRYCMIDSDCPQKRPLCDPKSELCVICTTTSDCSLGQVCIAGDCLAGCKSDRDCPAGLECNRDLDENGRCVQAGDSDTDADTDLDTDADTDVDTDTDSDTDTGPAGGLALRLTWDSDIDLDLHLLRGSGHESFGDPGSPSGDCPTGTGGDCHWKSRCPDWGVVGNPTDDPSLDVDDVEGPGPELISFGSPPPGTYTVVVHYFPSVAGPGGNTRATVSAIFGGAMPGTVVHQTLEDRNRCWDALEIEYPAGQARTLAGQTYPCELP